MEKLIFGVHYILRYNLNSKNNNVQKKIAKIYGYCIEDKEKEKKVENLDKIGIINFIVKDIKASILKAFE